MNLKIIIKNEKINQKETKNWIDLISGRRIIERIIKMEIRLNIKFLMYSKFWF